MVTVDECHRPLIAYSAETIGNIGPPAVNANADSVSGLPMLPGPACVERVAQGQAA